MPTKMADHSLERAENIRKVDKQYFQDRLLLILHNCQLLENTLRKFQYTQNLKTMASWLYLYSVAEIIAVGQDLLTARTQPQMVPPVAFNYTSRLGFIRNVANNRNLNSPRSSSQCPRYFFIGVRGTGNDQVLKMRWIQAEGHVG